MLGRDTNLLSDTFVQARIRKLLNCWRDTGPLGAVLVVGGLALVGLALSGGDSVVGDCAT